MKLTPRFFLFFYFLMTGTATYAEVMTFHPDNKTVKKIRISKLSGLNVNEDCFAEKEKCLKSIEAFRKSKVEKKENKTETGNPASVYCEERMGQSEILRDSKQNEYDFCLIEKKYLIDSWSLFKTK